MVLANDLIANAEVVTIPANGQTWTSTDWIFDSTTPAGLESGEASNPAGGPYGVGSRTAWARYTPLVSGSATFDLSSSLPSGLDTEMGLFSGPPDATTAQLTRVAGDGDSGTGLSSLMANVAVTGGTTYYVQVGIYAGGHGTVRLAVTGPASGADPDPDPTDLLAARVGQEFKTLRAGLPEQIRDVVGAALRAGTGITLTVDDAGDTVTVSASGAGSLDAETVRDTIASMLQAGTGVTLTYDDPGDKLTIAATGGGGGGLDLEAVQDAVGAMFRAGTGVTFAYDDPAGTITVSATGGGGGGGGDYWTKVEIGDVVAADFVKTYNEA